MTNDVKRTFQDTLKLWEAMSSADHTEAEVAAERFEAAFYKMMDLLRSWYHQLPEPPRTLEGFLALPLIAELTDQLPAPLLLNFETEAELIVDHLVRIDEDKYD